MKDFVTFVLTSIIGHEDKLKISESEGNDEVTIDISVHPEDSGIVIGKGGKNIQALRTLLSVYQAGKGLTRKRLYLNVTSGLTGF